MPDFEPTHLLDAGSRTPAATRPAATANGAWPDLPAAASDLAEDLAAFGAAVPPARPEYMAALKSRFEQDCRAAAEGDATSPLAAPSHAESSGLRDRPDPWGRARLWAWARPIAGAAIAVLAVALVVPRLGGTAPPPVDRATLVARNALAWSELTTLTGAFETGDGWYFEEWIRRDDGGALRFKRYIRPPARTPNRPQWNVSDGRTEWVVDAASRAVRVTRDAVPGDFTAVAPNDAMQCTSLALPPGMTQGDAPVPLVLDGRGVYRLSGRLADGAAAVFWVDAEDALVRRIDRPGLGTVWQRQRLSLDPPLAAAEFRPDRLSNL